MTEQLLLEDKNPVDDKGIKFDFSSVNPDDPFAVPVVPPEAAPSVPADSRFDFSGVDPENPFGAPETSVDPDPFGFGPTLAETLPPVEKRSAVRVLASRVVGLFVKKPKSSVGDMEHSLSDQTRLGDYRSGTEHLMDGGFEKTGKYDPSREGILTALHDEAITEDELVDVQKAQQSAEELKAAGERQIAQAGSYPDGYSDSSTRSSAYAVNERARGNEAVYSAEQKLSGLAEQTEALKQELRTKEEITLAEAQAAAIRNRS